MSAVHRPLRELRRIASRFRVLAEPARLAVLEALREGPKHVNAIVDVTGLQQANLSKHLRVLHAYGMVERARTGRYVYYAIHDPDVVALCDVMCRPTPAPALAMPRTISSVRGPSWHRPGRPERGQPSVRRPLVTRRRPGAK